MNNNTVELWDETYRGRTEWRGWPYEYALAAVPSDFTPLSVLDVGCGLGNGLAACRARWPAVECYGVDFSAVGIEAAQRRVPDGVFMCRDLNTTMLRLPRADLVLCCQTLEHVDDPAVVERMIVLAAARLIVVTVPLDGKMTAHHPHSFSREWFMARNYEVFVRSHPVPKDGSVIVARWSA